MLNKSQTRKFILDWFKQHRPHLGIERISAETYKNIEARLRAMLKGEMERCPSVGKTFKVEI